MAKSCGATQPGADRFSYPLNLVSAKTMPIFEQIVREGKYFVIKDFSFKKELAELMRNAFLEAVDRVSGEETGRLVRRAGLSQMHKFIDPDHVIDLQDLASQLLKTPMLRYTGRFAQEMLGMNDDFYLDIMTIARIKTPFEFARKSSMSYLDYSRKKGRTEFKRDPALTYGYHRDLPFPSWAHGPHSDTYFGHSYDGINLWWSVDGVTEENGMVFYPQIICDDGIPVLEEPPYLGPGVPMPLPRFFNLGAGDVIAFNSDTLHATRVNLSDVTRVSYSTRLNPWKPRFDQKNFRQVKLWIHSRELKKLDEGGRYKLPDNEACHKISNAPGELPREDLEILVVPKEDPGNLEGKKGSTYQTHYSCERKVIECGLEFKPETALSICNSSEISESEKVLVRFANNMQFVLARVEGKLTAINSKCPHLGYDLIDGAHEGSTLICPGHGIAFDLCTGKSRSDLFQLAVFPIREEQGRVIVEVSRKKPTR